MARITMTLLVIVYLLQLAVRTSRAVMISSEFPCTVAASLLRSALLINPINILWSFRSASRRQYSAKLLTLYG